MASTPYPLPRETRESSILSGDGTAGPYGPTAFKVFDQADIEVYVQAAGEDVFQRIDPLELTVSKSSGQPYDTVSVTFSDDVPASSRFVIRAARTHERLIAVTRAGSIDADQLEKELSRQATVLSELRRDVDRAVQVDPGTDPVRILPGIDGDLMKSDQAGNVVPSGVNVRIIGDLTGEAQAARDAARQWATAPEDSPVDDGVNPPGFSANHHRAKAAAQAGIATAAAGTASAAAGVATTKAGEADDSAIAAAADRSTISGWKNTIEDWKDQVEADRSDVQADKVIASQAADAASQSAADANEALDMLFQYGDFNSRYIGEHAADPVNWNSGSPLDPGTDPLIAGLVYFNTVEEEFRTWSGSDWASGSGNTSDFVRKSQNLNDLPNKGQARTNIDVFSTAEVLALPVGRAAKATLADDDTFQITDSAASNVWKKITWANLKERLKDYFDTLYGRVALGLATSDSPRFAGINLGHASDTLLSRVSAGLAAVDGNTVATLTGSNQALETGAHVVEENLGNLSGQTITIDPSVRPAVNLSNNGAGSIAFHATRFGAGRVIIENVAGAGEISVAAGIVKKGDEFDTIVGSVFLCGYENFSKAKLLIIQKVA